MKLTIKRLFAPRIDQEIFPTQQDESTKTSLFAIPYTRKGNRTNRSFLAIITTAAMLLFACQAFSLPLSKTNPSTPIETTVTTSSTPSPTNTNIPTATTVPPTPTVEPPPFLSGFLTDVQIRLTDGFDTLDNWHTFDSDSGAVSNGMFVLKGKADWSSGVVFNQPLTEGFGVMIKVKTGDNADLKSGIIFNTGEYNMDNYKQFGIYYGRIPQTNLVQGKTGLGYKNLEGNFTPVANSWHSLFMAIGRNGELLAVIWNPNDTTKWSIHHVTMGEKWANLTWEFLAQADIGETVYLKDFSLFTFGQIDIGNP